MRSILFIILSLSLFSCEKSVNDSASFEVFVDGVFQFEESGVSSNQVNETIGVASNQITFTSDNLLLLVTYNQPSSVVSATGSSSFMGDCLWFYQNHTLDIEEKNEKYSGTFETIAGCNSDSKTLRIEFSNYELN